MNSFTNKWSSPGSEFIRGMFIRGLLGGILFLLFCCSPVTGMNGDLLQISSILSGKQLIDVTRDNNLSFWVLGANGSSLDFHRIYQVSDDLTNLMGFIENPHTRILVDTDISTTTVNCGIAFRSTSNSLFVLSNVAFQDPTTQEISRQFHVREVDRNGTENPASFFVITPEDGTASLSGLSYDLLEQKFWTLDSDNDRVLKISLDGSIADSFLLPGKVSGEIEIRGGGIYSDIVIVDPDISEFATRVYTASGDIFNPGPSKLIQLASEGMMVGNDNMGQNTGVEVPLVNIPDSDLLGFHVYTNGSQQLVVIVARNGTIYRIEQVISDPLPPNQLSCNLNLNNQVELKWKNLGSGLGGMYGDFIQILRNGTPLSTEAGDVEFFLDTTPVEGTSVYSLRASENAGGPNSPASCGCEVTVGSGGMVKWTQTPGRSVGDVTRQPETGDIFVTDTIAGAIMKFDSDLQFQDSDSFPSPWADPVGITFIPEITLGFPPTQFTNLIAVTRASGNQISIRHLTGQLVTNTTLRFNNVDINAVEIAGLTFNTFDKTFIVSERTTERFYTFGSDLGQDSDCVPSTIQIDVPIDRGVTYDPLLGTLLSGFEDGRVREVYDGSSCSVSEFNFSLVSLGEGFNTSDFTGGIQIADNTLLVTGRESRALYQILIFPFSPHFIRGEVNRVGPVDMNDVVMLANYLFRDGVAPICLDSGDINDDGVLDIGDPIYLVFWLFVGGRPMPGPPFPDSGPDPTFRDNLGCSE